MFGGINSRTLTGCAGCAIETGADEPLAVEPGFVVSELVGTGEAVVPVDVDTFWLGA